MPAFSQKQRIKIALGGFLSFIGIVILILCFITITKTVNLENMLEYELIILLIGAIGLLDILGGILLIKIS